MMTGYFPKDSDEPPAREAVKDLNREKLWQDYISCRKPVVIDGLIQQPGWHGEQWVSSELTYYFATASSPSCSTSQKDLSYLRKIAGSTLVKIEPVDAIRDQFGTSAKRKTVQLSTFLDMLEDPELSGKWYMTTQYEDDESEDDEDDEEDSADEAEISGNHGNHDMNGTIQEIKINERLLPKLDVDVSLPAPTDSLAHLFPLPGPEIMGNLVLQQCNLWMGNGKSGKSSGLHHDFHDNLYMLVSAIPVLIL
jgi:hypothetical protein